MTKINTPPGIVNASIAYCLLLYKKRKRLAGMLQQQRKNCAYLDHNSWEATVSIQKEIMIIDFQLGNRADLPEDVKRELIELIESEVQSN